MRSVSLAGAALLSLVLTMSAQAQKKAPNKSEAPLEAAKVLKPGNFVGKLGNVNSSTFVLRLEFDHLDLKPGASKQRNQTTQYQNLLREYSRLTQARQKLANARTPQEQMNALRSMQQISAQIQRSISQQLGAAGLSGSPYVLKKDYRDLEVELAPNVSVRTNFLPFAYDDMGNPKKYTPEEIKELKGPNPSIPGYKSGLNALKPGQGVKVTLTLVKEKTEPVAEKKVDKEKKDADKKEPEKVPEKAPEPKEPEKVPEKGPENKPAESKLLATRILILRESDEPIKPEKGPKKNK
jgi:hypothetical protein